MKNIIVSLSFITSLLLSLSVQASFQLETMTVILDAGEPRKVFNVKNMSREPILLSTKVSNIEGSPALAQDILVSPPITRIEPQQSQQINFVLKNGVKLSHEELLKVSFQGVSASKENVTKMPIRQDIALLVVPEGMVISQTPWDALKITQKEGQLIFKNTGKQVVRLSPNFTGLPNNEHFSLEQFYLRPNELKTIKVSHQISEVTISPLSRYGFKTASDVKISVTHDK